MSRSGSGRAKGFRRPSQLQARGRSGSRGRFAQPKRTSPFLRLLAASLLLFLVFLSGLFAWSFLPGEVLGNRSASARFLVKTSNRLEVIGALEDASLIHSPILTRLYVALLTPGTEFVPRAHLLTPGISARELIQRLAEVGSRTRAEVTFPEGWTHRQMASRLEDAQICSALGFQEAVFDTALLAELELNAPSAEGYLFPAKYSFHLDSDPRQVVRRLVREAKKRFTFVGLSESRLNPELRKAGLTPHGVLVLASIVERETAVASEAPRVARVFLNRLLQPEAETKGRLQSDPSAGYGCQIKATVSAACRDSTGRVSPEMLQDLSNPYNTYRHAGLPPGPISNPGERTIRAVLAPASGGEFFFVADGQGGHTFSETYAEHRAAVQRLRALKSSE